MTTEPTGDARTWKVYRAGLRTRITRRTIPPAQLRKGETVVKQYESAFRYGDVVKLARILAPSEAA